MIEWILKKAWSAYFKNGNEHSLNLVFRHFIIQKVLRINSNVDWPIHWTSKVSAPERINRGSRTPGLSQGCHIDGRNGIQFGKNVWVGPHVAIISMNHDLNDYSKYVEAPPIKIGDDCWIGAKAIILPSVVLGSRTVVAAGSVVTKSFTEGNQILGGNPAKPIRKLP